MTTSSFFESVKVFSLLAGISALLFAVDLRHSRGELNTHFLAGILDGFGPGVTITQEILAPTSLAGLEWSTPERVEGFFEPYLSLPEGLTGIRYGLQNPELMVYELRSDAPYLLVKTLLEQKNQNAQFFIIDKGTFYLNQVPAEQKTHNFLAIVIDELLYGFQYRPHDHPKILEIIDELRKNV